MTASKRSAAAGAAILLFLAWGVMLWAEKPEADSVLTLQRIFDSAEFKAESFGPARWMKDGVSYTTLEASPAGKNGQDVVLYDAASGKRTVLIPAEKLVPRGRSAPLEVEDYEWSADGTKMLVFTASQRVWRRNTRGDFWILERATGLLKKVGASFEPSSLQFAKFSPDGGRVAYVHKNNIYVEDLASGAVTALTRDGSETTINGTFDWVYEEEFTLRDGFRWSPDGTKIAFFRLDSSPVRDFHMINNTEALYPRIITIKYPKAGEDNSRCEVGVVAASGGEAVWVKVTGDPKESYIPYMDWAGPGELVIQHLNRLQNKVDVILASAATGEARTVFTDRDEAWVEVMGEILWLRAGRAFLWLSERDGWCRAYSVSRAGREIVPLSPAAVDVLKIDALDEKGGWLYFTASPDNPGQRYLYRVSLDGRGTAERLSPASIPGTHAYQVSPQAAWAFHTHSAFGSPSVVDLVRLPRHASVRTLAANKDLKARLEGLKKGPAEFFKIDVGGGLVLDGWCLKPPDFDPAKKYPLFFHVYGEPAGQTVLDRWGGPNYLWHLLLSQQGYIVASIDNRGTPAPRGRAWRKSIYRQMGILASADQAAAARALLKKWPYADPERIGIWGWSAGGHMTLNMLFRYPETYQAGIAVASVSDQRYYDTIYQERFMGLPKDNVEGYKNGSPITFAHQLRGRLLIVHGTGDDNVHYQSFEALINELVAHDKPFAMMAYPNRSHGIFEGKGTTLHLYGTMLRFLLESLPPGGRPRAGS